MAVVTEAIRCADVPYCDKGNTMTEALQLMTEELRLIVANQFGVVPEDVTRASNLEDDFAMDDIDALETFANLVALATRKVAEKAKQT